MSDISIKLTADVAQANTGLKSVQQNLAATAASAVKADSSLDKLGKGSAQATNALTNLGRVVQDAPFGFIGIANNINPLLESFQRLQEETGSAGSAFKVLASSIAGAGGLGFAVSIGTAALSLFGLSMQKSVEQTKKSNESIDEYGKLIKEIAGKIGEQAGNIDVLVKAYQRENISQNERVAIIEKLKQISPEYFNQLKSEKTNVDDLTAAYNAYAASIDKSIIIEIKRDKLKKLQERKIQLNVDLNLIEPDTRLDALFKEIPKTAKNAVDATQKVFGKTNPFLPKNVSGEQDKFLQQYELRLKQANNLGKEIAQLEIELAKLEDFASPNADKAKKEAETIQSVLSKLAREIDFLNTKEIVFNTNETKNKVKEIENTIEKLIRDFKVSPNDSIIQKLFGQGLLIDASFVEGIDKLKSSLQEKIGGDPIKIPAAIDVKDALDKARKDAAAELGRNPLIKPIKLPFKTDDIFKEQEQRLRQFIGSATDEFSKLSENIFSGIGEALGSALTGAENPIGGFFLSIGNLLADSIQNLGKYIITTSTLVAKIRSVLNAAFAGNPALGIAVGVGLIAVGSALKSSLPKFADGVRNFGGGLAIVGERGPEVVRLPSGSDVIPNHRINGMAAGEQTVFIADTRISGSDIVLSYTRQTNRNSRNGF